MIYDTSYGFVFDKDLYWLIENPKLRHINDKETIRKFVEEEEDEYPENIERDKYILPLILPFIEATFSSSTEMYSAEGMELLQREIGHFKELVKYDSIVREIDEDMKRGK